MKRARWIAGLSIASVLIGLVIAYAGPAAAGGVTPADTVSPSPSPSPSPCEITALHFKFLSLDDAGNSVITTSGSTPPIVYGDPVAYGAFFTYFQGFDPSGQPIDFHRIILGTSDDRTLTINSDDQGTAQTIDQPRYSAYYYASWTGSGDCDGTTFTTPAVLNGVRVSITNSSSNYRPRAGQSFLIRGGVSPNHAGKLVTIEWHRVGSSTISHTSVRLDSLSHYSKTFVSNTHGAQYVFRAIFPKQDEDHQANATGWSATVKVQ